MPHTAGKRPVVDPGSRLTVNLGFRYEFNLAPIYGIDILSNFSPTTPNLALEGCWARSSEIRGRPSERFSRSSASATSIRSWRSGGAVTATCLSRRAGLWRCQTWTSEPLGRRSSASDPGNLPGVALILALVAFDYRNLHRFGKSWRDLLTIHGWSGAAAYASTILLALGSSFCTSGANFVTCSNVIERGGGPGVPITFKRKPSIRQQESTLSEDA
jgi:hypothetical protein